MHIKKGDTVVILSGDDKGKTGKVVRAFPAEGKILVEGVNVMKKHERPRQQGKSGQVVDRAMPIFASKAAISGADKKETKKASAAQKPAAKEAAAKK